MDKELIYGLDKLYTTFFSHLVRELTEYKYNKYFKQFYRLFPFGI